MTSRSTLLVLAVAVLTGPLFATQDANASHRCRPVGTWLIDVTFPDVPTPLSGSLMFKQLLVLNADRTLSETNNGLHPNSTPLTAPVGAPPTTGSDGFGTWKWKRGCRIEFSLLKFIFAGDPGMPPMEIPAGAPPPPPAGVPIGFFKVSGTARIVGNMYSTNVGDVKAAFIFGQDPFSPDALRIDAGDSFSSGMRLLSSD